MSTQVTKAQQISALVAQLKSGALTKQQLFEQLQRMQSGEVVAAPPASSAAAPPPPPAVTASRPAPQAPAPQAPAPPAPAPSQDAMSSAIAAAMAAMQALGAQGAPAGVGAVQQQALMAAALALEAQRHGYGAPLPALLAQAQAGFGGGGGVMPPAAPPRGGGGAGVGVATPGTRRARADAARARSSGRASLGATAAAHAARTPGGATLSDAQAGAFQERVYRWAADKREELLRRAREEADKKLAACTFKPAINETSRQVVQTSRRASSAHPAEIYDRLYAQAAVRAAARTPGKGLGGGSPGSGGEGGGGGGGSQAAPRGESPVDPECTFQPKTNASLDARPVRSRYMEPPPAHARAAGGADVGYTFMPKTNPVRPAAMPSAAMYVQAPIYERLARTNTRSQVERERQVAADLERMEAAQREKVGGGGGEEAAGAGASAPPSLPDLSAEEQRRLAVFLARQEAAALRKKKHLEEIEKATAPSGQPALCDKSLKIVESATNNASFLERLQRSMVEKEEELAHTKARLTRDIECTFAPAINPASKALRSRSVSDMSRGDALKKETATRLLRLRLEQESLEGVTFKPAINDNKTAEGRLKVLSEPESYVARLVAEAASAAEKARRAASTAEESELAECTFTPQVHDAPEYIKRIARHMAMARGVKAQKPAASGKPDWK